MPPFAPKSTLARLAIAVGFAALSFAMFNDVHEANRDGVSSGCSSRWGCYNISRTKNPEQFSKYLRWWAVEGFLFAGVSVYLIYLVITDKPE